MNLSFVKKKKFYIPVIIVALIAGGSAYSSYKKANQPPNYEMATVTRQNIVQKVEATGNVQSVNDLDLRFETIGTLAAVKVKEGDRVKAGQLLANLNLASLNASVAQAEANLQQRLVGATDQDKDYYAAAVESARVALEQAKAGAGDGGSASINAVTVLQGTLNKLDDALTQADAILGVDNPFTNDSFESYLAAANKSSLNIASLTYTDVKKKRDNARLVVGKLTIMSPVSAVQSAFLPVVEALTSASTLLSQVNDVLAATSAVGTYTQTTLDTQKTTITTTRTSITTQLSSVNSAGQTIIDAQNSIPVKQATYDQAVANYQSKIVPPREVDVASLRAAVWAAQAARDKAIVRAPVDGVVAKVNKKVGELVTSADVAIQMVSPHFEVKVDIPETDVAKLKVGDTVDITLDAFGPDTHFSGVIAMIDPASTEIQDVVYYKVNVALNDTDQPIKPGMTANVTVITNQRDNVLAIPVRAVRTADNGGRTVRILENKIEKSVPVTTGLKDSEGRIEIISGLSEGQEIIVSTKQK